MRIVFLANVDWFFQSHFLYLAERARRRGWEIALATHVGRSSDALAAAGLDLIALPTRRGSMAPAALWGAATIVGQELKRQPDTLLHGFGIFGIVVGGLAGRRCGIRRGVYTITGRGYSAAARTAKASVVRGVTKYICDIADGPDIRWLAENSEDFEQCGLERALGQSRTALVGGAGIDPTEFACAALPERPPLRVALVARMIWSKGIDTAVRAIQIARNRGADIRLTLAGPLDADNPRAFTAEQLRSFEMAGDTVWLGRVDDINELWARHHVALLPSRGGEGLPRSLIEAAACGRPIMTSDVPGCRTFAEETGGWSVPADDPEALAGALTEVYARDDLEKLGRAARETVLRSYTQDYNWDIVERFYENLFGPLQ
jgi:glycosyltransferase involved in cell wall biosynthesis